MFDKFLKNLKKFARYFLQISKTIVNDLDQEEKRLLLTAIGFLVMGFLIYTTWRVRLITPETEPQAEETTQIPQQPDPIADAGDEEEEEEEEEEVVVENRRHDYRIVEIADLITEKDEALLFGESHHSDFVVEYREITHAVFENPNNLSLREWIDEKIGEMTEEDLTTEEQRRSLDIFTIREVDTALGVGLDVIRMNGYQSGELFLEYGDYILSFRYHSDGSTGVSNLERRREHFIRNIE